MLVIGKNYISGFPFTKRCFSEHIILYVQRPHKAYPVELAQFHSTDYVEFLHRITPNTQHLFTNELARCINKKHIDLCSPFYSFLQLIIFKLLAKYVDTYDFVICCYGPVVPVSMLNLI